MRETGVVTQCSVYSAAFEVEAFGPSPLELLLVRPEGLEPPAYRFEACRSIQLSYGRADRRLAPAFACVCAARRDGTTGNCSTRQAQRAGSRDIGTANPCLFALRERRRVACGSEWQACPTRRRTGRRRGRRRSTARCGRRRSSPRRVVVRQARAGHRRAEVIVGWQPVALSAAWRMTEIARVRPRVATMLGSGVSATAFFPADFSRIRRAGSSIGRAADS
jgi:hypothetical protein